MKTLVLLSVLVLLVFQVHADPIPKADEETRTEEQLGKEDQEMSVFLGGPEASALQDEFVQYMKCYCRKGTCRNREAIMGNCERNGERGKFCCT